MLQIIIYPEKCNACGKCQEVCPKGGKMWTIKKIAHVDHLEYCHVCTICASNCPKKAILIDRNGSSGAK